ncbi:MAG: response regulator [Planctomycetes bacterium]|nr:response regulator [Planctomycetota bacterium]
MTRVLIVVASADDDELCALALRGEDEDEQFDVIPTNDLDEAIHTLDSDRIDVVVMSLDHSDGPRVDAIERIRAAAREAAIIVITREPVDELTRSCIEAGAQDFLCRDEVTARNLHRAIGHAMTRKRENQLRELKESLAHYRHLSSTSQHTTVTAALAGTGSVKLRSATVYDGLIRSYVGILDGTTLSRDAKESIVTRLGDANGGPRDLVDLHIGALDLLMAKIDESNSHHMVFEARLLALEMMGLLVDYYRVGLRRSDVKGGSS